MAVIRPFAALRYDPAVIGDVGRVVAPPYDVIDDAHRDALYDRSPYNVVRLILGREADRYASASDCLAQWRAERALVPDAVPALYLYRQDFTVEGVSHHRAGVIGAVRLEPFESGAIRPHEKTLEGPKEDRLNLMKATRANLSPIFGLYPGDSPALDAAKDRSEASAPLADVTDESAVRHRLWSITDPPVIGSIAAEIGARTLYIADGHHRYETALAYRDIAQPSPLPQDHPANYIMMCLCSMADPGLVILPTHRVLTRLAGFDATRFVNGLRQSFETRAFPNNDDGAAKLVAALHSSPPGVLGIVLRGAGSLHLAILADPTIVAREVPGMAPAVRRLTVTALDTMVLRKILGIDPAKAAHDGRLRYVKDATEAIDQVRAGRADLACLLGATRIEEVAAVCDSGETMPEKSTYFFPKLGTGFVFHTLE